MFRIIDLLTGKTVIDHVDENYINTTLPTVFEIEDEHGMPEYCWLSLAAVESFDHSDDIQHTLSKYVSDHGRFIDADGDNQPGTNETGCYFGFAQPRESAHYHVYGTVRKGNVVLPSFLVKVSDQDTNFDELCGFGFTDEFGRVDIGFDKKDFSTSILGIDIEGSPEIVVDVAELDIVKGIYQSVKRHKLPKTQELSVKFDIDLAQ